MEIECVLDDFGRELIVAHNVVKIKKKMLPRTNSVRISFFQYFAPNGGLLSATENARLWNTGDTLFCSRQLRMTKFGCKVWRDSMNKRPLR